MGQFIGWRTQIEGSQKFIVYAEWQKADWTWFSKLESQFCHWLALWPWSNSFNILGLTFSIFKETRLAYMFSVYFQLWCSMKLVKCSSSMLLCYTVLTTIIALKFCLLFLLLGYELLGLTHSWTLSRHLNQCLLKQTWILHDTMSVSLGLWTKLKIDITEPMVISLLSLSPFSLSPTEMNK